MKNSTSIAALLVLFALSFLIPFGTLNAQRGGGPGTMGPGQQGQQQGGGMRDFYERTLPLEYDNRPFDLIGGRLPPYYVGYEPGILYDRMKERGRNVPYATGNPVRSPRSAPGLSSLGERPSGATYAVRSGAVERSYDAPNEVLTLRCRFSGVLERGKEIDAEKGLSVKYRPLMDNRYAGADASGAKVEIEEIRFQEYIVAFANAAEFPVEKARYLDIGKALQRNSAIELPWSAPDERLPREAIIATIHLTPKQAKQMKDRIAVLLILSPAPPFATAESLEERPGRGSYRLCVAEYFYIHARLLELWVYDLETGKVLEKVRPRKSIRLP